MSLFWSNDNSNTPYNEVNFTNASGAPTEDRRYRINLDISNEILVVHSLRMMLALSNGAHIFLSEMFICGSNASIISTTTTTTTTTVPTTTAIANTAAIITASSTITNTSTITDTAMTPVTQLPTTTSNTMNISSSSDSTNIGAIVAPIIVVILIAVIIVVVILVFMWWRRRKTYHIYDQTTDLSRDVPYYSTVQHPSSVQNEDYYDHPSETQQKSNSDEKPTMVYAVPNKRGKKEKRKSTELRRRSSIDFNYRPQRSPEMQVRSREQTLSLINPDYERKMELDIYAAPDLPKRTEASTMFDENEDDPIYSEAINPSDIMGSASYDSALLADHLCPYASIYADPMPLDKSEGPPIVSNKNIEILHQLGTGQFGEVILANTIGLSHQYLGIGNSTNSSISIKVAVKTLKADPTDEVQKSFEKEIKFMSRLKDDNVIRLLGICTTGTPFIMMEYMENGDLNQYLQQFEFTSETEKLPGPDEITLPALVYMSFQIASGMKYLSSHKFIHRDLATRNILVGVDYTVKIADFGMSQNLYSAYYYKVGGRIVLPIRWMAYECFFGKFSIKTDVWAYGITLWEIFTLCRHQPLYELSDQQVIENAIKGKDRMIPQQPEICPTGVYTIMKTCFPHEPPERAGFDVLCDQLNEFYSNLL
ncbi:class II receptor tyrosine kinase-like [Dysidea avara]|uniref:class II receptor tyrosine kinase-like n=1 Tax=Dysidea avara TaxID=196820 RepID=UPI0033329E44